MFEIKTDTFHEHVYPIPNGTESIPTEEIQKRNKSLGIFNQIVSQKLFIKPELDREEWTESELKSNTNKICELKPTYNFILKYLSEKRTSYPVLYSIAEYEVITKLLDDKNDFLKQILEDSIYRIERYLNKKKNKIGICLQKDPEDSSFEIYLIVINTEVKNYEEQNIIEDKICDILEEILNEYYCLVKDKNNIKQINEIKRKISILVDGL